MPRYKITSPSGAKFTVEAPEGASQEQVLSYAMEHMKDDATKPLGSNTYANQSSADVTAKGLLRGATMGGADETMAAIGATLRSDVPGKTWQDRYDNMRGAINEDFRAGDTQRPITSIASQIGGGVIGTALPLSKVPVAATGVGRVAQAAAIGGGTGGISGFLSSDDGSRLEGAKEGALWGAPLGAVLPLGWEGSKLVGRGLRNVVDPLLPGGAARNVGRLANKAAGAKAPNVIRALQSPVINVPGSMPNAGQASVPAASAEFAALQKIADEASPSPAAALTAAQEKARQTSISTIARNKKVQAAYEGIRSRTAKRNYEAAFAKELRADPDLIDLSGNPYVRAALPTANDLAKAGGITPKTDLAEYLHYVKIGIDKQLQRTGDSALVKTERQAAQKAQNKLIAWLKEKNPEYDVARESFARQSVPINQMKVGQELEKALTSPLSGGERAGVFATAVRNAPATIKKATGPSRYTDLKQILSPEQAQKIAGIQADLLRDAEFDRLAAAGSKAARSAVGQMSDPVTQVNFLERTAMIVNAIIRRAEGRASDKTLAELAGLMSDPAAMAKVMQNAKPYERSVLMDAFNRSQAAGVGASAPLIKE